MTLQEVLERCGELELCEQRCVTDEYVEIVFFNRDKDKWNETFTAIFGPPVSPMGQDPTEDDLKLTKDYGGVWRNQVLYKKIEDNVIMMAMLWPWSDNDHTTIRMARLEK